MSAFNKAELDAMHRWCLKYRTYVRSGKTPTKEQNERFMAFQKVCYAMGGAHGRK